MTETPYFLDTNILIYAALGREAEETKRAKAAELILTTNFSLTPAVAYEWIEELEQQPCAAIDKALVKVAMRAGRMAHAIRRGRRGEVDADFVGLDFDFGLGRSGEAFRGSRLGRRAHRRA